MIGSYRSMDQKRCMDNSPEYESVEANLAELAVEGARSQRDELDIAAVHYRGHRFHVVEVLGVNMRWAYEHCRALISRADSSFVANTSVALKGLRWCDGSSETWADGGGSHDHRVAAAGRLEH